MKYFFSSPSGNKKTLLEEGAKNFLLSYAVDAKDIKHFMSPENKLIIDSGAFSVWNQGKGKIDIKSYQKFCEKLPEDYTFINLDVIPETGSSKEDKERCAEEGYENFLWLSARLKNVMPVYHYGDDIKWLHNYVQLSRYIGISPANDTSEKVKREFLREVFRNLDPRKVRTHALGYSSFYGLTLFPFYSVDSISYKRIGVPQGDKKKSFFCTTSKFEFFMRKNIRKRMQYEQYLNNLWKLRGINYDS